MVRARVDLLKPTCRQLAMLSAVILAMASPIGAQQQCEPSRFKPPLEAEPGANLYWHQAGTSWQQGCDEVIQTDWFGYAPRWYAKAEMQALRRDNLHSHDFATLQQRESVVLGSGSLDDEYRGGVRVMAGLSLSDWYRVETSYLGSYDWCKAAAVRNENVNAEGEAGNLFSPFTDFGAPAIIGLDYNYFASARIDTELDDAELNLRRRISMPPGPFETSFVIGLRYTRVEERFGYRTESLVPAPLGTFNEITLDTKNDMFGVQIGLLGQWMVHLRTWIDCQLKAVLYSNSADVRSQYVTGDDLGPISRFAGSQSKTTGSGLLDLSVAINHQFSQAFTLRIGYSSLWMGGMALGADNFAQESDLLLQGPVLLDNDGQIVFHGPMIGVVGAW
jgi:hypothetical protein